MSALEMLVAENAAADNGEIRIAADEVVGEQFNEVKKLGKHRTVDHHGNMLGIEHDAVFVVVDIGAVLKVPVCPGNGERDHAVILSGRVVDASRIALIFQTKLALGIAGLRCRFRGGDSLRILLRLAQVDRNIKISVFRGGHPPHILLDAVAADIVNILREAVKPVCCRCGTFRIVLRKQLAHLMRGRCQNAHQLRIKKITAGGILTAYAAPHSVIQQPLQNLLQRHGSGFLKLKLVQLQNFQNPVCNICLVTRIKQVFAESVLDQSRNIGINLHGIHSFIVPECLPEAGWLTRDIFLRQEPARSRL